jgi:hypothetical protein
MQAARGPGAARVATAPQLCIFSDPPIAFHAEWPPFMYNRIESRFAQRPGGLHPT